MVQKQVKRRTSLVLGAVLALLLGVAAGFLLLALPVTTLENITTTTHLSSIMIQAEPPISPNDRTVLAVLAAILASGIGWVLVDWLLFGRVGMTTLIRPREDEYEEDDDAYRPTDPLDLISSEVMAMPSEWPAPVAAGDTRRPLSARTDIGDFPPSQAAFAPPQVGVPPVLDLGLSVDSQLPPIDQILPGHTPVAAPAAPAPSGLPTLDLGAAEAGFTTPRPSPPPAMPAWLPSPGVRPDPSAEDAEVQASSIAVPAFPPPPSVLPDVFAPPQMTPAPLPVIPVDEAVPAAAPDYAPPPPIIWPAPAPMEMPPTFPVAPPPVQPQAAPPQSAPPIPASSLPPVAPASTLLSANAPLDRVMINDLLTRLEKGMRARRANAAAALSARAQPQAAVPSPLASFDASVKPPPPAGFAMASAPVAPPQPMVAPLYTPPVAPPAPPPPAVTPPPAAAHGDAMIDQPLHMTLEQLRSMVRR